MKMFDNWTIKKQLGMSFAVIPIMIAVLAIGCLKILTENTGAMTGYTEVTFVQISQDRANTVNAFLEQAIRLELSGMAARMGQRLDRTAFRRFLAQKSARTEPGQGVPRDIQDLARRQMIELGFSFLTIVDLSGQTLLRVTNPGVYGDSLFGKRREGETDLKALAELALKAGPVDSLALLGQRFLRQELVLEETALEGITSPGDTLADQARVAVRSLGQGYSGPSEETRGLALLGVAALSDLGGEAVAVALGGRVVNRDAQLMSQLAGKGAEGAFTAITAGRLRVLSQAEGQDGIGVPLSQELWDRISRGRDEEGERNTGLGKGLVRVTPLKDATGMVLGGLLAGIPQETYVAHIRNLYLTADAARKRTKKNLLMTGGVIMIMTILVGVVLSSRITGPIQYLIEVSQDISRGHYDRKAELDTKDEFGQLAEAFNTMSGTITSRIARDEELINRVEGVARRMGSSAGRISEIVQTQVSGSAEQAAAVNEVTTTSEEIAATARQIADNASSVKDMADDSLKACQQGAEDVKAAIMGMDTLKNHVQSIAESMLVLGKNSQKIGEVINIIDEISKQTNLLSLNAAIEAAGAGEEGKRFAVVAVEVKRLADRTVDATKQIKQLIDLIQNSTNRTILLTEDGSKAVDAGFGQVEQVGTSLDEIVTLVKRTARAANEISLSTQQQTTASDNMALSITDVSKVAGGVLKSSEDTRKQIQEINDLAAQLNDLVQTDVSLRQGAPAEPGTDPPGVLQDPIAGPLPRA